MIDQGIKQKISTLPSKKMQRSANKRTQPATRPRMTMTPKVRQALAATAASLPAGWNYIFSATGTADAPILAALEWGDHPLAGSQMVAWGGITWDPINELWMFTKDGYIISSQDTDFCMTVVNGNVIVNPVTQFRDTAQLWTLADNGTIVSQANNQVLTVGSPDQYGNLMLGVVNFDPSLPATQQWSVSRNPLPGILAQNPLPFPTWAPGTDLGNAYAAIMDELSHHQAGFDLRAQYTNLSAPLSAWLAITLAMPKPSSVTDTDDWNTVQQQLVRELTAVIAVWNLFTNYTECHLALFSNQEALLNKAITDAQIAPNGNGPQCKGVFSTLIWGLMYTTMQLDPETAIIANIIQTGINVAAASNSNGVVGSDAFEVAVSQLWNLLSQGFDEILQATGTIENQILNDWGMLQAVYAAIITNKQSNQTWGSLAWSTNLTGDIVTNSANWFLLSMLQVLVPTKYQIYQLASPKDVIGKPPQSCLWNDSSSNTTFQITNIPTSTSYNSPDYMMTNDIIANKVPIESFYLGRGGWVTPMALSGPYNQPPVNEDAIILMVSNQTSQFVSFSVSQQGMNTYTTAPIAPWKSETHYWSIYTTGIDHNGVASYSAKTAQVTVSDSDGNTLANFSITVDVTKGSNGSMPPIGGLLPLVSGQTSQTGYSLTPPVCNPIVGTGSENIYSIPSCQITITSTT